MLPTPELQQTGGTPLLLSSKFTATELQL